MTFRDRISAIPRTRDFQGKKGTPMDAKTSNYTGWQSDVIVDMIKRYGFPFIIAQSGASFRGLHDSLVNYGNDYRRSSSATTRRSRSRSPTATPRRPASHGRHPPRPRRPAPRLHGHLLRLPRPRARLRHGRHRPDGHAQAPPPYRLDPHRPGAGQRGARLHQVGLPADVDPRRAGELRARLFDHDDRAEGPDLHVLRRGPAGSRR